MTLSRRELNLAVITIVIIMAFLAWVVLKPRYKDWQSNRRQLVQLKQDVVLQEVKAEMLPELREDLDRLLSELPVHPEGVNVVADMMRSIETYSRSSGLVVSGVFPDRERQDPDRNLYEFSIRCNWSGELPQLTRFLYALHAQGAVMDVRQLNVQPSRRQGILDGKLIIDFAYRRLPSDQIETPEPAPTPGLTVTPEPPETTEEPTALPEGTQP